MPFGAERCTSSRLAIAVVWHLESEIKTEYNKRLFGTHPVAIITAVAIRFIVGGDPWGGVMLAIAEFRRCNWRSSFPASAAAAMSALLLSLISQSVHAATPQTRSYVVERFTYAMYYDADFQK